MCRDADDYFQTKHPYVATKDLVCGERRDGEFVKYMRWKNYWEHSLNPDGTPWDFTAFHHKLPEGSKSNGQYLLSSRILL